MKALITLDSGDVIFISGQDLKIETGRKLPIVPDHANEQRDSAVKQSKASEAPALSKKKKRGVNHHVIKKIHAMNNQGKTSQEAAQLLKLPLEIVNRHWTARDTLPEEIPDPFNE